MRARPILFSGAMVRALLAGSKTQTRRIVKPQPEHATLGCYYSRTGWARGTEDGACTCNPVPAPYGVAGDLLWVRETCRAEELSRPEQVRKATRRERQVLGRTTVVELDELDGADVVRYLADDDWQHIQNTAEASDAWSAMFSYRGRGKGRIGNQVPAIHMPRWASRLTLEITEVRVERLQDISAQDADAECFGGDYPDKVLPEVFPHREGGWGHLSIPECYGRLWEHINGQGSWAANPYVWAVSFEVHRQNIDSYLQRHAPSA